MAKEVEALIHTVDKFVMPDSVFLVLSYAPLFTLVGTLFVLTWKACEHISIRKKELQNLQFERYHQLIKTISKGEDGEGQLKHVSSMAYIGELQNYPAYKVVTEIVMCSLLKEWEARGINKDKLDELRKIICVTFQKLNLKRPCK